MPRANRTAFVAGVFLLLSACVTEPAGPRMTLRFQSTPVPPDTLVFDPVDHPGDSSWIRPFSASVDVGGLEVLGSFLAPCGNYLELDGELSADGDVLTVRVSAPPLPACADATQPFHYAAEFAGLPAGSYRVVVTHDGDVLADPEGAHGERSVYDTVMSIP